MKLILRVISGSARGHKLKTIKGMSTRPTTDRVKESLFNILSARLEGSQVLDLFAGTGSLGIEALSRGASRAVFVDKSSDCVKVIRENLEHTKLSSQSEIYGLDFAHALDLLHKNNSKFDMILLDPPYNKNFIQETLKKLQNNDIILENGIIVAEHSSSDGLPEEEGRFIVTDTRKYGDTVITIYKVGLIK